MLLDSNIIIYAGQTPGSPIVDVFRRENLSASAISRVEVLGFHGLTAADIATFDRIFRRLFLHAVDGAVIDAAIHLRLQRNMSLGDSIIAGTAVTLGLPLVTRNVADFRWIRGLQLIDPFAAYGSGQP